MTWTPAPAEYADLELALDGIFETVDLTVPAELAGGGSVEITDPEGTPVATYFPESRTATPLRPREHGLFQHLRRTPEQIRAEFPGRRIAAVPVDAPLDTQALSRLAEAGSAYDVTLLLVLIGPGSARLSSTTGLLRATLAAAELLPGASRVVPVPLASRADTSNDAERKADVASAYGDFLDIATAPDRLAAIGYALGRGRMLKLDLVPGPIGTALRADRPPLAQRGLVVFFTGLSGSGKSTLAQRLRDVLLERTDRSVTLLDGDVVRRMLSAGLGFSKPDREANIRRIGFVAAEIARHRGIALCAPIAPYASTRGEVRRMVTDAGGTFVLVHVATPLEECERRDRKGLYAKARAGEIAEFTGISDPYEAPVDAELTIDTSSLAVDDAVAEVFEALVKKGWLPAPAPRSA
jgi:sulfate adenylyltransferase